MNENHLFLPDESLTLLAARPMMGEREFAVTIAQMLQNSYPKRQVIYFSLEVPRKWMYCKCNIPADSELCVIDHLFHFENIHRTAQLMQKCGRLGLIVVDNLQLMECFESELMISEYDSYENTERKHIKMMHHILYNLKLLARELQIPVLVLAYLAHNVDNRKDKHPVLLDLRPAKITEQDADQIWLLDRDSHYDSEADKRKSELIIVKNRYGDCETIQISYERNGECNWFTGFDVSYDIGL